MSASAIGISVGAATPALSQDERQVAIDSIIVTAERREQSLQDAPVAVTAFVAAFIEDAGIDNATDLVGYVPGLHLAPFSRVQALPALRGAHL